MIVMNQNCGHDPPSPRFFWQPYFSVKEKIKKKKKQKRKKKKTRAFVSPFFFTNLSVSHTIWCLALSLGDFLRFSAPLQFLQWRFSLRSVRFALGKLPFHSISPAVSSFCIFDFILRVHLCSSLWSLILSIFSLKFYVILRV